MTAITVTNIPDDLMILIELQARRRELSIEEYVLEALETNIKNLQIDEWLELTQLTPSVEISTDKIVALVRDARDSR